MRHGVVPAAVRGPVVGPVCRACTSEIERVRMAGGRRLPGNGVSAAMTGHFKINGVGTLWLPGDDEVMAKDVDVVMIVWELWRGTVTREASMERDEMIFS